MFLHDVAFCFIISFQFSQFVDSTLTIEAPEKLKTKLSSAKCKKLGGLEGKHFSADNEAFLAELQIRGSMEDKSKIIFLISAQKHML